MLWLWSMVSLGLADHVAVLEFTGSDNEDLISILSDQARAGALDQLDPLTYSIMTRENMMLILEDMGKNATCLEGSCEVNMARNIGADLVISGTISQLGDVQLVMLKLHQSDSGTLLAMEKVQGADPVALVEATFEGVQLLLRKGLHLNSELAKVTLTSTPKATVFLDGDVLCQQTPCVREVEAGSHVFRWESSNSMTLTETVEVTSSVGLHRKLDSTLAQVSVLNTPKGIHVSLDGQPWKQTPIQAQVPVGTHRLSIDDFCYEMEGVEVTLGSTERYSWSVTPSPKQTLLTLDARDTTGKSVLGEIYADGVLVGDTRSSVELPLCTESIRVESRFGSWQGDIRLQPERNQLSVALSEQTSYSSTRTISESLYPMVDVMVGRFWMGSTNSEMGRNRDEQQHQVMLTQPFSIGQTEVTQGLWEQVTGQNPSHNRSCGSDCPVDNISWCDAVVFANMMSSASNLERVYSVPIGFALGLDTHRCNELSSSVTRNWEANGYRLPTEAEWEWSAREMGYYMSRRSSSQVLISAHRFSGSSTASKVAWYEDTSRRRSHPVCQKEANLMDLCDMSGNVFEWVEDWYGADTSMFSNTDPVGPTSGETKVLRGGSHQSPKNVIRNAFRYNTAPGYRDGQMGLRLVRSK